MRTHGLTSREFAVVKALRDVYARDRARVRAKHRAMDGAVQNSTVVEIFAGYKPYYRCSDGIMRTEAERSAWLANGMWDERSEQRRKLRNEVCAIPANGSNRPGHICEGERYGDSIPIAAIYEDRCAVSLISTYLH